MAAALGDVELVREHLRRDANCFYGPSVKWFPMRGFQHDKLGMFIHWGPYSYLAGEWNGQRIPVGTEAEWVMQRFNIPVADYREMAHHLNPCISMPTNGWRSLRPPG